MYGCRAGPVHSVAREGTQTPDESDGRRRIIDTWRKWSHGWTTSRAGSWGQFVAGLAVLAVVVWRVGTGPFTAALGRLHAGPVAVAVILVSATTLCSAARWRLVAAGLGLKLSLGSALARCYRSQFLNAILPGGVLGDVHRGVLVGAQSDDVSLGLRTVVWERSSGQAVQLVITAALVLPLLVSPGVAALAILLGGLTLVSLGVLVRTSAARPASVVLVGLRARARRAVLDDVRRLGTRRIMLGVIVTSLAVLVGYVAVFALAARVSDLRLGWAGIVPLALTVLVAAAIPANVAGWGPREAAAAWAFHAVGLLPGQGVTVAVLYGLLTTVATVPGGVLLALGLFRHRRPGPSGSQDPAPAIGR